MGLGVQIAHQAMVVAGILVVGQGKGCVLKRKFPFPNVRAYRVQPRQTALVLAFLDLGAKEDMAHVYLVTALADELAEHPEVTSVVVKGAAALVPVVVDLGIAPLFEVQGTRAVATYMEPTLRITEFNPETGRVRIRVTPGAGNSIRSTLTTGCIHVYGTSDLTRRMQYIPGTGFDLTPYLREETKGEANLSVSLGTHTFIKIKAETTNKHQGEIE